MKKISQPSWLAPALAYMPEWLGFQVERNRHAGVSVALARQGKLVAEFAIGSADLHAGVALTPRHRFRIASHSKTFTASGIMLLREQGKIGLDDPVGRHVGGLSKAVAGVRIAELLSHGAGITRDGPTNGQFMDTRPYLSRTTLLAELDVKQPLEAGVQLKYSNHGYGLLGLAIEEITGTPYAKWIARHVIEPAGLRETVPDMPLLPKRAPMAKGHSLEFPFGERMTVPGDNFCDAMAAATGFVSTASDVARFFSQLAPDAGESILSAASRRAMMQRRWRDDRNALEAYYGLGTMVGPQGAKEWFGHTGGFQGFISRTARFTASGYTITVLTNSQDGPAFPWVDGLANILAAFQQNGAPSKRVASWSGRWWNMWGANDLVPMGDIVCVAAPALPLPFDGAHIECAVKGKDAGVIQKASAYGSPGEPVRRVRNRAGKPVEVWLGGSRMVPRATMIAETTARYARPQPRKSKST
jgi:D-alanyl-D-alanine carboxypeptidase